MSGAGTPISIRRARSMKANGEPMRNSARACSAESMARIAWLTAVEIAPSARAMQKVRIMPLSMSSPTMRLTGSSPAIPPTTDRIG